MRASRKVERIRLWGMAMLMILATVVAMSSCLFTPPVDEPPEERDTPPFWDPGDVDPSNSQLISVDRSIEQTFTMTLSRVRDINSNDEITFQLSVYLARGRVLDVFRDDLKVSDIQESQSVTTYGDVTYVLQLCDEEFNYLGDGNVLPVRLRLIDSIPPSQWDMFQGQTEHIVDIYWSVQLLGECESVFE